MKAIMRGRFFFTVFFEKAMAFRPFFHFYYIIKRHKNQDLYFFFYAV